jgi:recombination protein RecA
MTEKEPKESKTLELAIAQLERQFGNGSVMRLGNKKSEPWPSVPTGALPLDSILGIGGLPLGRVVEIYGPESSGKSTIALSVVAEAQAKGLRCAYIDAEHALDPVYMAALGVDLDELLLAQPSYGEEALEIVDKLIRTGEIGVVVVDSVASLIPKAELEGDMESAQMGLQARMMAKAMRKLVSLANENKTLIIFINQLRNKIGVMFGNPETTPGGMALRFAASVRIDVRKREDLKDKSGDSMGIRVKAKIIKNKMAPPMKVTEFDILYGKGIDKYGCVLDAGFQSGVFTQKGAWVYYKGASFSQGREMAISKLREDPILIGEVKEQISNGVQSHFMP